MALRQIHGRVCRWKNSENWSAFGKVMGNSLFA